VPDSDLQRNKHNSYWYGGQYSGRQTALGSWYGLWNWYFCWSVPWPLGSLYILILPSISITIIWVHDGYTLVSGVLGEIRAVSIKFVDTQWPIRSRKSKKDRQYNVQKTKRQTTIHKALHRKLKIEQLETRAWTQLGVQTSIDYCHGMMLVVHITLHFHSIIRYIMWMWSSNFYYTFDIARHFIWHCLLYCSFNIPA